MLGVHFLGQKKISIDELPIPEPHDRWVLVKTRSASICGTDRENLEGPGQKNIPGHESAGEVVAVDKPVHLKVGDRVAINCHVTCGHCEHCLRGDLYFCDQLTVVGFDYDGGFGEYMLVPEASCMPLPDDITFEQASLLVDMLGTPFRAVKRAHLTPGSRIAIWGAGPIGLGALMTALRFGAEVTTIDPSPYRLEMARELGAHQVIQPPAEDAGKVLREWTGGRGIDVGFDCVGSEAVAQQALASAETARDAGGDRRQPPADPEPVGAPDLQRVYDLWEPELQYRGIRRDDRARSQRFAPGQGDHPPVRL